MTCRLLPLTRTTKDMKKIIFSLLCLSLPITAAAQQPLGGFIYGTETQPAGDEWQSPQRLALPY